MIKGYLIDTETECNDIDIINEWLCRSKKYSFLFEYENDSIYVVDKIGRKVLLCEDEYDKALLFIKDNNFCISLIREYCHRFGFNEENETFLKKHFNINLLEYKNVVNFNYYDENYFIKHSGETIYLDIDDFINEIKKSQNLDSLINQNKQNNKENNMQLDNLVQFKIQEKIMDTILKGEELSISKIMILQSFSGGTFDISDMLKIKLIEKFSLNDDKEKMDYKQIALLNMVQNGKFDFQFFFALNLVDKMVDKDDDFAEIIKLEIINSSKNGFDSSKIMELIIQQKLLSTL